MQPAARVPTVPSVLWDHDHYVRYKQSATTDLKRWKEDLRREIEGMRFGSVRTRRRASV